MGRGFLKNTGKILTVVILLTGFCSSVSAAEIRSELTRSRIPAGESTTMKVMISGSTSDIRPLKVPAINGLEISLSGSSRSFQFINGRSWTGIILSFKIQGYKKGVYRVPPFIIEADGEKLQTGEFVLTVDEGESGGAVPDGTVQGEVELTASEVYAGEPVIMRYYIRADTGDIRIEGMREQPEAKGFLIKHIKEGDTVTGEETGNGRIYIASYCLVAAESGSHDIGGGSIVVSGETGGGFFSQLVRKDIRFPKKKITVRSLPSKNRPKNFNGDVGEFSIQRGDAGGTFTEGEEIRVPVKVRGRGNLLMMSKLSVENQDGIKLLVEEKEPVLSIDKRTLTGEKDYILTIIPERDGDFNIGRIFLTYFNPYKGTYEQAESLPVSFSVSPADSKKLTTDVKAEGEEKNSLPVIILIVSVIIVLGFGILLLLQTGRYRIVKTEPHNEKKKEPEPVAVDHRKILREEFEKAYSEHNRELFLQKSEKYLNIIADESGDKTVKEELKTLRDKINFFRYGGAEYTDEDMKNIYDFIKKLS
ncbi:MAG TPA: BatD family protein [Spirochaetota bacterium]|nr:BatD family protein [Spirochaetota bacterium]